MARIPRMNDQRQRLQGLPDGSLTPREPATPAGTFGPDLTGAGREITDMALKARDRADTARVMEADSALTEHENRLLYDPEAGALNARGKNAFGLPDQVMPEFDKQVSRIREDLRGPQRDAFDRLVAQRRRSMDSTIQRHVHGEIRNYESQQAQALVAGSQVTAANHYSDPERIGLEMRRQRGAIMVRAQNEGWSPEQTQLELRKAASATHGAVVERFAANDPQGAMRYYLQHGPDMTPEDRNRYDRVVRDMRQRQEGEMVADSLLTTGSVGVDGVWERMIQRESNGQQFDRHGQPLTSSAGAVGIAQVMPDTGPEAARMAGLEWDEERYRTDESYNLALGRAYFENLVERYDDPMLAAAAYNGGMGNVDAWIKRFGDPRTGEVSREEFVRQIPFAETQGYVQAVTQGMEQERAPTRAEMLSAVNSLPGEVRDIAKDRLEEHWAVEDRRAEELYTDAQEIIEGGAPVQDIPHELREMLSNKQLNALRSRARELSGVAVETDYRKWTELSMMTREELAQIDDPYTELRPHLDDARYREAVGMIADAKGISGEDINTSSTLTFNQRVTNAAQLSGIVPANRTPARYTRDQAEVFSRFQNEVARRVEQAERNIGRKMTGNEQQEVIDEVLLDTARQSALIGSRETYLWAADEDEQGKLFVPREDIPDADYETIENLMLSGGRVPTRKDIERAYAQYRLDNLEAFEQIIRGEQ